MAASGRKASGSSGETEICSKSVTVEQKRIFFNLKQNSRGRFLKVRHHHIDGHSRRGVIGRIALGERPGAADDPPQR